MLTPAKTELSASAPIIMVLSGLNSSQSQEINRDELTRYVAAGEAELVYPLAYRESWNRDRLLLLGGQGRRQRHRVHRGAGEEGIDPGNERPIYLMGYSNSGRFAYTIACTDPQVFDGIAVVKAEPHAGVQRGIPAEDPPGRGDRRH